MIPIFVLAAILGFVPLTGRLSCWLAQRLNDEWHQSAVDWTKTAGLGPKVVKTLETQPPLPVPGLSPVALWVAGGAVALFSAGWVWQHPVTLAGVGFALALGLGLLLAILVDMRIQLLPDLVIWPLAALGAIASLTGLGVAPQTAMAGALAGGGALWLLATLFKLLRGHDGLGMGDVKLTALAGLWLGWTPLPWFLMAASVGAIVLHLLLYRAATQQRLAFGPALAIAFLAARAFLP